MSPKRAVGHPIRALMAIAAGPLLFACGGSPSSPGPVTPPGPPPVNRPPIIESIRIQGSRPGQPANFADLSEVVDVTASVSDEETAPGQLEFLWTASAGTFDGAGPSLKWQAPAEASTPTEVTLSLEVVERYGSSGGPATLEHRVSTTAMLSLHNSVQEVGDMARQFLLDFSDSSLRDLDFIMRNFSRDQCPDARDVDDERDDVADNRLRLRIVASRIGAPRVTLNFGGTCAFRAKRGDACAVVPVFWDSIDLSKNERGTTEGFDHISAAYSGRDSRWWLCSSSYEERAGTGVVLSRFLR